MPTCREHHTASHNNFSVLVMPGRLVVSVPREVIVTYNRYETCCHAQDPAKQSRHTVFIFHLTHSRIS